jgi:hypothetical protein
MKSKNITHYPLPINHSAVGNISVLVLVFGLIAGITLGGLVLVVGNQLDYTRRNTVNDQALAIAEAGINYYRWHLAHEPEDLSDGTGGEPGPYIHDYNDPQGGQVGNFELNINEVSGNLIEVTSTGYLDSDPDIKRTIRGTFGEPSLAQFAFLHNSNVWFGTGMTVEGPVLSNGGIRQDGVNTSTLGSYKQTYTCGLESGCDEDGEDKPGIWGAGGPDSLWEFPVTNIDFAGINVDFNSLKNIASSNTGYFGPSGAQGYHLIFNADGTADVYEVNTTDYYKGWSFDFECQNLYQTITSESIISTTLVADNPVYFFEDTLWVEGTLNGQTTVTAARFPLDSYQKDIWIPDNLVYLARDGMHKLGLIAQHDIVLAKDVPEYLEINGALLAQSSRILRHHYNYHNCKQGNPAMKNQLTIYGSVISNLIAYWNFGGGGGGNPTSGFVKRDILYDPYLYYDPPPFFPSSGKVELISWDEVDNP